MRANQKPRTLPDDDAHGNPASGISDGDSAAGGDSATIACNPW